MTKKLILPLAIFSAAAAIYAFAYFWTNYGGMVRNLQPAPQDIAKLIAENRTPLSIPAGWSASIFAEGLGAYHGSWNRSAPTGYKIVRYDFDAAGNYLGERDFIDGWLTPDGQVIGRPADIFSVGDGTYVVSDDKAGVLYLFKSNH